MTSNNRTSAENLIVTNCRAARVALADVGKHAEGIEWMRARAVSTAIHEAVSAHTAAERVDLLDRALDALIKNAWPTLAAGYVTEAIGHIGYALLAARVLENSSPEK